MRKLSLAFPFPLDQAEIFRRRTSILAMLLSEDEGFCSIPVKAINTRTLNQMLRSYDELFFEGLLRRKLGRITVTLSSRMTSAAGKFICTKGLFGKVVSAEIRMSSDFLIRLIDGPFLLNGLSVATPQEAFLIVFEHELCHAIETLLYGKTGHSQCFMALANGLFGHTGTQHSLPTRSQEAAQEGLKTGVRVRFSYQENMLVGFVSYIGKAATVMVPAADGKYRDRYGRRYAKYRVPLNRLEKM